MAESEKEKFKKKEKRVQIIVLVVITPILIASAVLIGLYYETEVVHPYERTGMIPDEIWLIDGNKNSTHLFGENGTFESEIAYVENILQGIDLECYNVNWYGIHGFQVIYKTTKSEIVSKIGEDKFDQFLDNDIARKAFELYCPHVINRINIPPDNYDPNIGMGSVEMCLEGSMSTPEYCYLLKSVREKYNTR